MQQTHLSCVRLPYSGLGLCGWCRSVHVLTYDEMVRPAAQAG